MDLTTCMGLREYQDEAVSQLRDVVRSGVKRVVLQAGTGAGKTIMAADVIRASQALGKASIFLAHRRELIHQCSDKLRAFDIDHGILMAGEPVLGRRTQVASVQTLTSWWTRRGIEPPEADLVVIDECHRATAKTYRALTDWYRERGAVVLGLTATPMRGDGSGLADVFDDMVCCPSIADLTEQGYLVPVRFFAPTDPDLTKARVSRGDYVESDIAGIMDQPKLVGDIVEHWLRHASDRKTVVFGSSVAHSAHLAQAFVESGIAAEHLDGKTPKDERDDILRRLSAGDVQVVCNCEVLCEGWDQPDVSCLVLARPTKSPVRFLQMVGRVLRPWEGKTDALVLDHSGAVHEHGFPEEFGDWKLEEGQASHPNKTQRKRQDADARMLTCEACFAMWKGSPVCPECGTVKKTKGRDVSVIDGELGEVREKGKTEAPPEIDHRRFLAELLGHALIKAYKPGWAAHKYKEKFGKWPAKPYPTRKQPSPATERWIRHKQIAWAKRRKA